MAEQFIDNNYEIVNFEEFADVYIINTCTVTNMSDRKSRQIIRRAKQINPNSILVATGCYAQTAKEELEKITDIDLIVGNTEKKDIVKIVEEYRDNKNRERVKMSDINKQKEFVDFGSVTYTEKTRAVIKVQDGCNNFCSYCIIPYAKGRVRSRKLESVVKEITEIAAKGIKEVVITGIHVASYGIDFDNNTRLIDLLEAIQKIDGIKRIRLGSLEPNIITEEFVNRLKKVTKMCDHFHLSLQSGCDETLKRMNRKYTFEKEVNLLRKTFPDVALTTDVIVGFPGETEEEFNETYKYLSKIRFTKLHVFKYSPRKGTVAAKMKNQIDSTVKEKRSHKLIELSNECEIEFLDRYVGKELKVLFEKQDGEYIKGHTTNYLVVKAKETELENQIKDLEEKLKSCAERMQKAREEGNEQAYAEEKSRYNYLTQEINKLKSNQQQRPTAGSGNDFGNSSNSDENNSDNSGDNNSSDDSSDDNESNNENDEENDKDMDEEELNLDENDKDEEKDNEKTEEEKKEERKQKIKKAAIGALGGAIGFGLSFALQPGTAGTVISVGRLVYSTAKKGLKVYTEKHKDDENNKIIKMVGKVKEFTKEQAEKHPKITSAISKVNNFLKKPETQVFLNGMAAGYTIGKISQAVYKMHEASAMEKKVPTNPEVDKTEPEMMKDVPDVDGTPAPNPTPVVTDPTPTFDPTKPVDLSSLGEGYVSSYSSDPVSLITSAGKNAMFDKINVVDGKTWVHFTQGNGAGYAWFPADEVLNALDLSDISELTGEVSGGMHL